MFGRSRRAKTTVAETAGTVTEAVAGAADAVGGYVDPLAKDEKLRQRLVGPPLARGRARRRGPRQAGRGGLLPGRGAAPRRRRPASVPRWRCRRAPQPPAKSGG